MDPLSITAGIATLATLTAQLGVRFQKLRETCAELPGRIHALNDEVADLEVVLIQLSSVIQERNCFTENDGLTMDHLMLQAREKLEEINTIIERLTAVCCRKTLVPRASLWRKLHPKLQSLQEEIKVIKSSLIMLLGASNSRDMMRVRLDLEALSSVATRSAEREEAFRDQFINELALHHEALADSVGQNFMQVDQRVGRIEELLKAQMAQMQVSQSMQLGTMYGLGRVRSRTPSRGLPMDLDKEQARTDLQAIGVRVTRHVGTICRPGCLCNCHSGNRSNTPGMLDSIVGKLFVGYAGLPLINPKCDTALCQRRQSPSISAEYWFPLGFCWSQIIRFQLGYEPNLGPQMSLSTLRQVPDDAQCVTFALKVMSRVSRPCSTVDWPVHEIPISRDDDCPSDKAGDLVLRGGISARVMEILRALTEGTDLIENQNFRQIHKIVLGLSLQNLEEEILQDAEDIDVPDAMGRTALEWAAARGDDRAVTTLLSYGANPNSMDTKLNTPLTLAANQNHTVCVRLLLEAGANPDPPLPPGVKFGTPLHCAARNASDPLLLKTLLDFNANIEASGYDGFTPLIHVARNRSAQHAVVLLEHGANINATSKDGRTPLTTAITYNNHHILQLLLDRWYEYSECPRLKGPNLLNLVVQYADLKTIEILSRASHLKLSYDNNYVLDQFAERIRGRPAVTDEIIEAFDALLDVLRQPRKTCSSRDSLMESGLLSSLHRRTAGLDDSVDEILLDSESEGSDACFEDAQEKTTMPKRMG